jgi:uncharacterized protein (DUF2336 family)
MSLQERREPEPSISGKDLEQAARIARGTDVDARRALATREDLPPELLFFLAEDKDDDVRRNVAGNRQTPRRADQFLARDFDEGVRGAVADKMARVARNLATERRTAQRSLGIEVLETLARDTAAKVRARLSEAVGDLDNAPEDVIRQVIEVLARDTAIEVARPVLERSTLLSDDFLVSLVEAPKVEGTRTVISQRAHVSERVSDAIVDSADEGAITSLLSNTSAQIREETLDQLLDAAPGKTAWHAPLVRRPKLAARQVDRLGEFVAAALVEELSNRTDIDPASSKRLKEMMSLRIDGSTPVSTDPSVRERNKVVELYNTGRLGPKVIDDALRQGRRAFVLASLSVRSGLDEPAVHAMVNSASARAVTALAWKSELSMEIAEKIQRQLSYIPDNKVIKPGIKGEYPMDKADLEMQIRMFAEKGGSA